MQAPPALLKVPIGTRQRPGPQPITTTAAATMIKTTTSFLYGPDMLPARLHSAKALTQLNWTSHTALQLRFKTSHAMQPIDANKHGQIGMENEK